MTARTRAGWVERALAATLAVLLPAGAWAAVAVDPDDPAMTVVAGGVAGATSFGGASLLDEEPPAPAPAATVAPLATTTTAPAITSTTKAPPKTTSTTKAPPSRAPGPTTTTTFDLPEFMKANPNPPGHLPAASSWTANSDGISLRMWIEPAAPVAGQPVQIHLEYTGGDACCIVHVFFGDDSPQFLANHHPPCVSAGNLSAGTHTTVVTHTWDAARPHRTLVKLLAGDLCSQTPEFHHLEMFACVAVGPGTPLVPGCDPLPTYGPYSPQ